MTIFEGNGETAWAQYHKQILEQIGDRQKPFIVQPLAIAQRVEWDTQSAEYNMFLKQDIANSIPGWNPLYTRTVGRNVADEYKSFLDQLNSDLISGSAFADKHKLEKLDKERRLIRNQLEGLDRESNLRYNKYLLNTPVGLAQSRSKWEEDQGISGDRYNLQQRLMACTGQYMVIVNNAGGDLAEIGRAISALNSATAQMQLPSSPEFIQLGKEFWDYYYKTSLDGDIFQFKNENAPFTVTLNSSQSSSTSFSNSWNASASAGWCFFFSAGGSVTDETHSRNWQTDTTEIKISFKNIKSFNIVRGQWFKGGLVQRFAPQLGAFFGPAGRLNVIPTELILGLGMSIEITTSEAVGSYFYHRHHTSGGGGFSIGPFSIGGRGGSTSTYESTKVEKTSTGLRIEDTSGRAVVLGVVSERPQDLQSTPSLMMYEELELLHANQAREALERVWRLTDEELSLR